MSSSALTSASTTSSSSCVMSASPSIDKPSQYFPRRIVALLGEEQFNHFPFKKLESTRLLLNWCPIHQRNFIFAGSRATSPLLPQSLFFNQMQEPIVTGLIGENPFIAFQIGVFPFMSCHTLQRKEENNQTVMRAVELFPYPQEERELSSAVISSTTSSKKFSYQTLQVTIGRVPLACVTGFIFNPISLTTAHPRKEDMDCFRTALFYSGRRSWGDATYRCYPLSDQICQAIDRSYDMNPMNYASFGQIDHQFRFRPFNSEERFFTQFVHNKEAFVFIKWAQEYQTEVYCEPIVDSNNPTGAYTAETTFVKEWNVDTLPWMENEEHNVILSLWQKTAYPAVVRFYPTWFQWGKQPYSERDDLMQGKLDESVHGLLVPIDVAQDSMTKEKKAEQKKEVDSKEKASTDESKEEEITLPESTASLVDLQDKEETRS